MEPPSTQFRRGARLRELPPAPPSWLAIRVGLGDFVCWGLTVGFNYELFSKLGLFVEARVTNAGLMTSFLVVDPSTFGLGLHHDSKSGRYEVTSLFGFGGTVGAERFFGDRTGLRGPYVAVALETVYRHAGLSSTPSRYNGEWSSGKPDWSPGRLDQWYLVPHARGGYRLRLSRILVGLGGRLGAGLLTSSVYSSTGYPGGTKPWGSSNRFYVDAAVILDLGVYLK